MGTHIEMLDIFGLARMWHQGQPGRECLTDDARLDVHDHSTAAVELRAPGCHNSRLVIEVAQDAAGRWWAGFYWSCWHVPDGTACGSGTPIDAFRGSTRERAIAAAAAGILAGLPAPPKGKGARIFDAWRRELQALVAREERRAA